MNFKRICIGLTAFVLNVTGLFGEEGCESCCSQFYIRGDILYWTPRVSGLELNFGTTEIVEEVVECSQIFTTEEVDLDPHFNWDVGYRASAGFECNPWNLEVLWTHFDGDGKRSRQDGDNSNTGKVTIKLDQIDLAIGLTCDTSCCFMLKPFVGARAAKINEHIKANSSTEIILDSARATEIKTFNDKQKYWGVGPLFGLQAEWELGCGLGVYGTVAGSVLYGEYQVNSEDANIYSSPISKQIFNDNKRHVHTFDCNLDLSLGFVWHTLLCDYYDIDMKLGFEHHQYFNQNRLCVGRGDISFTGGIFSILMGF